MNISNKNYILERTGFGAQSFWVQTSVYFYTIHFNVNDDLIDKGGLAMKEGIHPKYQQVVFLDVSTGFKFLTGSTMGSNETIEWEDGSEYPLIKVDISSESHPFYTGQQRFNDAGGRVEKFKKKYNR